MSCSGNAALPTRRVRTVVTRVVAVGDVRLSRGGVFLQCAGAAGRITTLGDAGVEFYRATIGLTA